MWYSRTPFFSGHAWKLITQALPSAHTTFDVFHNCENKEDYRVWVPFHFLPGNNGEGAKGGQEVPLHQRLVLVVIALIAILDEPGREPASDHPIRFARS